MFWPEDERESSPGLTTFQNNDERIDVTKQVDNLDDLPGDPGVVVEVVLGTESWSINHHNRTTRVSSPASLSEEYSDVDN